MNNKPQTKDEARDAAYARLAELPAGTVKENYLPFVEAMCFYLDLKQSDALDRDNTAESFTIAEQQFQYWSDYERLTGRKWGEREETQTTGRSATIEKFFKGTPFLVKGKAYPSPLPPELAEWYCYTSDGGHSILCLLEGQIEGPRETWWRNLCPCPVKAVLRGYRVLGEFIVVDLPYSPTSGLLTESEDDEF